MLVVDPETEAVRLSVVDEVSVVSVYESDSSVPEYRVVSTVVLVDIPEMEEV